MIPFKKKKKNYPNKSQKRINNSCTLINLTKFMLFINYEYDSDRVEPNNKECEPYSHRNFKTIRKILKYTKFNQIKLQKLVALKKNTSFCYMVPTGYNNVTVFCQSLNIFFNSHWYLPGNCILFGNHNCLENKMVLKCTCFSILFYVGII